MTLFEVLPPLTAVLLFVARCLEMGLRKGAAKGIVLHPITWAAMVGSGSLVVGLALAEFFWRPPVFSLGYYTVGLAVGLASFLLRHWAARALGAFWSMHIEMRGKEHPLVTSGPYAWVRHPIYTAAFLELMGAVIVLQSWFSASAIVLLFTPAIVWRIRLEEKAMVLQFGEGYLSYVTSTPALLPSPLRKAGGGR